MRVLIVHNQLWAHYKSKLFSEIYEAMHGTETSDELLVAQIALYEASRKAMQPNGTVRYEYPYEVLFQRSLDQVGLRARTNAVFAVFDRFKPTVLNITGYFDWAQVLLMAYARMKGVRVVISSESSAADHNRSPWKELIKKWIVNTADAYFCFGKTSAEYLESLGVNPATITVRNAAVIDEKYVRGRFEDAKKAADSATASATRQFAYVGRLAPEKNLDMLLRAFGNALNEGGTALKWNLLLVGEGPERPRLQVLATELGISHRVIFAGGLPWYEVPGWLAKSDVLVLPSKSEPWGLVVNEAMVCGMPVIVSDKCGCAADLVRNGVNGFAFDPENQNALEKHLRYFITQPERIESMGRESLKLIAPFAAKPVAEQMVQTYRSLAASHAGK